MRYMYDAVTLANVQAVTSSPQLVACYDDGTYQNVAEARQRFPHSIIVPIAVRSSDTGSHVRVLDCETGDASPSECPGWVQAMRAQGVDPTIYCNTSTWPSVKAAFSNAGVAQPHYWVAQYDGDPTIPSGAVAKQYLGDYHGYDKSSVLDVWPGVDSSTPTPPPTTSRLLEDLL